MPEPGRRRWLGLVTLIGFLGQADAYGAEAVIDAGLEEIRDALFETLETRQIVVTDDAQTDRFALVYAQTNEGGHISISIRQLASPDRSRVNVTSDAPANPALDQMLLEALQPTP